MIHVIILDHINSREYTNLLIDRIEDIEYTIIDSTYLNTSFTESFNIGLIKGYSKNTDHLMICNNDISLCKNDILNIDNIIKDMTGIFSPVFNSPHAGVMSVKNNESLREVPWIEFISPIFSRDLINKVGILDQNLSYGWGVELDYCYRAKLNNYNTFLIQAIQCQHFEHKSQKNHSEYSHNANLEMNSVLSKKYGPTWQKTLSYPQWS